MRRDITRIAIVSAILLRRLPRPAADRHARRQRPGRRRRARASTTASRMPVVDGSLGTDGALTVSERITFEFHGNFSGAFRDIPLADNQTFEEIGVREGATDYDSGASTELGGFGLPDTFGAVATFDESRRRVARIVWHFTAADETRTFQLHYRVRGLTRVHNDAVDLFWQVWGDGWKGSLDQLDATLTIPPGVPEGSERIWGHPGSVRGTVQRAGRKITLAATGIPRNQFVELRTLLPRTALGTEVPAAQVENDDAFDRIVRAEQADFDQSAAGFRKLQRVLDNRPLVALAVVLAGLAAAIVLYGLAWLLYGREPEGELRRHLLPGAARRRPARGRAGADEPGQCRSGRRRRAGRHAPRPDRPRAVQDARRRRRGRARPPARAGRPVGRAGRPRDAGRRDRGVGPEGRADPAQRARPPARRAVRVAADVERLAQVALRLGARPPDQGRAQAVPGAAGGRDRALPRVRRVRLRRAGDHHRRRAVREPSGVEPAEVDPDRRRGRHVRVPGADGAAVAVGVDAARVAAADRTVGGVPSLPRGAPAPLRRVADHARHLGEAARLRHRVRLCRACGRGGPAASGRGRRRRARASAHRARCCTAPGRTP